MLGKSADLRLMVKVARLYYIGGCNQEEISRRFRTSRSTVSRLLKQAKELGIVTIQIQEPLEARYTSLEEELERRYGLLEAIVLEPAENAHATQERLGRAAADYLVRAIQPGQTVGVSMGTSLQKVVQAVQPPAPIPVKVVPLMGGSGRTDPELHANQLAVGLARALGGEWYPLHSPAVASTPELRDALMADPEVRSVLELAARCDVAVVGVGSPSEASTMRKAGQLSDAELEAIRLTGAVGDCCSQFFDAGGLPCAPGVASRVVGLPLSGLRSIPLVIAVAGGEGKAAALAAAMRGGYLKVLVTDSVVARRLLGEVGGEA